MIAILLANTQMLATGGLTTPPALSVICLKQKFQWNFARRVIMDRGTVTLILPYHRWQQQQQQQFKKKYNFVNVYP